MATYNNTITGGGTVGHPANAAKAYVRTSKVWDTADCYDNTSNYRYTPNVAGKNLLPRPPAKIKPFRIFFSA